MAVIVHPANAVAAFIRVVLLAVAVTSGIGCHAAEPELSRVSVLANNGMPRDIVARGNRWNFGPGSLWTHRGWQYAAYWDDQRQVSVARRELPNGRWEDASLPGYQRMSTGDRGKGGAISRGFGDGHEKVAMGISPDGFIHLSFDHHLSRLRYRVSKLAVASNPEAHTWDGGLFGPVQDHLGGPALDHVTYPSFFVDGSQLILYLRLGGGSGSANSHFFTYADERWVINSEQGSKLIDKRWSGGDGAVNAYPHGLVIRNGRRHLTWCWRDTPDERTCHDLCYAYSDDGGKTWLNNEGQVIGILGERSITADSPGVAVVQIPSGTRYRNGGSMTVDHAGRVHVLMRGERGQPVYFGREPTSGKWMRNSADKLGNLVAGDGDTLFVITEEGLFATSASHFGDLKLVAACDSSYFEDSKMAVDKTRPSFDGWLSVVGQLGKTVRVIDCWLGKSGREER